MMPVKPSHLVTDFLDLVQDGLFRAALDDAAFVLGDGAEGAAAEAAAHDVDREADHLPRRDFRALICGVRPARIGQVVDVIHLLGGERNRRRIEPHVAVAVLLHQRAGIAGIGFQVQYARGVGIHDRVAAHQLVGRQADDGVRAVELGLAVDLDHVSLGVFGSGFAGRRRAGFPGFIQCRFHRVGVGMRMHRTRRIHVRGIHFRPAFGDTFTQEGRAAQVGDVGDGLALGQAVRQFHQRTLGIAVEQDVGLGIHQHRAPHLVRPVVVVGNTAQASLDAADHQRGVGIRFAAALGIHQHGAIRALAALAVGRVGIVGADFAVGGIAVDHAVHVPCRHAEIQVGLAKRLERFRRLPVRLGDDTDAEPLRLQ